MEKFLFNKTTVEFRFDEKNIIFGFSPQNNKYNIVNLFILMGKFHIHKAKMSKAIPSFTLFLIELKLYFESLKYIENNKKGLFALQFYSEYLD